MNERRGDDYKHITRPGFSKVAALRNTVKVSLFSEYVLFVHELYKTEVLNLFIRISLIPYVLSPKAYTRSCIKSSRKDVRLQKFLR